MFISSKSLPISIIAIPFLLGIIFTSYRLFFSLMIVIFFLLIMYIINVNYRFVTLIFISFLIGLFIYQLINLFIDNFDMPRELRVLINRGLLIIIFTALTIVNIVHKKKISFFNNKANWGNSISLPFHSIKLSYFMLIGIIITGLVFIPIILNKEPGFIKSIFIFGLLFSIINAILEELIWRGIMLTSLIEYISVTNAIIITSIGFGMLHLVVGIPFFISLLFSIGGLFYGFIVIKTNSIYPAIIFHFVVNIGMVLSGMIL
ncbi:CPBP family intramembrane glutamic endopeptidase [Lysinibacillus telephonicus]|uniref:CPBP family intramembrane metalloprotease n=1 Tax=Lysinibacillus telephonicus TaxID=1714840 RepID=A0A431UT32_9BACI|nr:type II CAAX endopeptidase family protein [Lysinibacillus telephonicus]RTQ92700.1 CPBP family intramembrane metalloprotease [Lysinibacillus telephonicus]